MNQKCTANSHGHPVLWIGVVCVDDDADVDSNADDDDDDGDDSDDVSDVEADIDFDIDVYPDVGIDTCLLTRKELVTEDIFDRIQLHALDDGPLLDSIFANSNGSIPPIVVNNRE